MVTLAALALLSVSVFQAVSPGDTGTVPAAQRGSVPADVLSKPKKDAAPQTQAPSTAEADKARAEQAAKDRAAAEKKAQDAQAPETEKPVAQVAPPPAPKPVAPPIPYGVGPAQVENAKAIAKVALDRGLPNHAVTVALATAMQESTLLNLNYGDRDSLGLFQQRPSMGWGTPDQVMDPYYAAGKFYDGLVGVWGWESMRVTDAAQLVQRSAFPEAYQQWVPLATDLAAAVIPVVNGSAVPAP